MSALQALLPGYPLMVLSRLIEGISHLAIVVVGPTMIATLAPEARRPLAMTLWSSFFGVTYAVLALIGPLSTPEGLFLGHAAYMAALAMMLAVTLPPDPGGQALPMGNILRQHAEIYASPRLAAPAMGFCCYTFLYVAVLTLLPPETPATHRALIATGMPLVSIAVSLTLGVRLLGRMSAVRLVQWGYATAIPGFLILWAFWGQGAGMVAGGILLSAALGIVQGASFASIPELNAGSDDRARAAGAVAQLGNLGTTTGTPVLAALLVASGPSALALAATVLCGAGIAVHALQEMRRARGAG
jgi:predicted MFS family arabinose efflux permease